MEPCWYYPEQTANPYNERKTERYRRERIPGSNLFLTCVHLKFNLLQLNNLFFPSPNLIWFCFIIICNWFENILVQWWKLVESFKISKNFTEMLGKIWVLLSKCDQNLIQMESLLPFTNIQFITLLEISFELWYLNTIAIWVTDRKP